MEWAKLLARRVRLGRKLGTGHLNMEDILPLTAIFRFAAKSAASKTESAGKAAVNAEINFS